MHMANELLSVPVAFGAFAIAGTGLGVICKKAKRLLESDKLALMGVLGAFVFAAQMVNFQLPVMPGTSGHMVGAVLLAVILGPYAAAIALSSVVIIQCLIFQDGGLLALGCNIINIALVPVCVGYGVYRQLIHTNRNGFRPHLAAMLACIIGVEAGAVLVPIEASLSGVLLVPVKTFMLTMLGVHLLVGIIEGIITIAVLEYLRQVRPGLFIDPLPGKTRLGTKTLIATFAVAAVIIGSGLSLFASGLPDGLEWSYAQRPEQPDFRPMVENHDAKVAAVDDFQTKYTPLPDYSVRTSRLGSVARQKTDNAAAWTSFAAVVGSALTMALIWLIAGIVRKAKPVSA